MNLQSFRLVQGRLLLVNYLKVSISYFPLVLYAISRLKCIIHQNFGQLNLWMIIFYYSIYDRFIQRLPRP